MARRKSDGEGILIVLGILCIIFYFTGAIATYILYCYILIEFLFGLRSKDASIILSSDPERYRPSSEVKEKVGRLREKANKLEINYGTQISNAPRNKDGSISKRSKKGKELRQIDYNIHTFRFEADNLLREAGRGFKKAKLKLALQFASFFGVASIVYISINDTSMYDSSFDVFFYLGAYAWTSLMISVSVFFIAFILISIMFVGFSKEINDPYSTNVKEKSSSRLKVTYFFDILIISGISLFISFNIFESTAKSLYGADFKTPVELIDNSFTNDLSHSKSSDCDYSEYVVIAKVLNARKEPTSDSRVMKQAPKGSIVCIKDMGQSWFKSSDNLWYYSKFLKEKT